MASPDGLRLYLGKNVPNDVLNPIFEYGFHLWLAKPMDALKLVQLDRPSWHTNNMSTTVRTTIHLVPDELLTAGAWKLVDRRKYLFKTSGDLWVLGLAWPKIFRAPFYWIRDDVEWYAVEYATMGNVWNAWRFTTPEPSLPVDDAELEG